MVLSIMLLTGVLLLNYGTNAFIKEIQNKVDVSLYFKVDVSETDILKIQEELANLKTVSKVEYMSREQALQNFKEKSSKDQIILETLEEIGDNPLSASLNIKAEKSEDYSKIISYVESSMFKDKLLSVDFSENRTLVNRANSLTKGM
jgi:cell division transport system permease protein